MTNSQLMKLGAVLAVGVALVVGRNAWYDYQADQPNEYRQAVASLEMDAVSKIQLVQSGNTIELVQNGSEWNIASKSADRAMIEDLVTALNPQVNPLLISESQQRKDSLQVNQEDGVRVVVSTQGNDISLTVGPRNGTSYPVSIGDSTQVYAIKDLPKIEVDHDAWVDLTISKVEPTQVSEIIWNEFGLRKQDGGDWAFIDNDSIVNQDEVALFVADLNPLEADRLAYDQKLEEFNLASPSFTLTVTQDTGSETLEFYQGPFDYLAKHVQQDEYYVLDNQTAQDLNRPFDSFVQVQETQ